MILHFDFFASKQQHVACRYDHSVILQVHQSGLWPCLILTVPILVVYLIILAVLGSIAVMVNRDDKTGITGKSTLTDKSNAVRNRDTVKMMTA